MSAFQWTVLLIGVPGVVAFSFWSYARREAAERRWGLAALRAAALALLVLLIADPSVPLPRAVRGAERFDIIDASLSMRLPARGAESRWQRAVREADSETVLLFGDAVRQARRDTLARVEPAAPDSRLLPALRAAAEAGARAVTVHTDGAIEDSAAVADALQDLGVSLRFHDYGRPMANRWVADITAPPWAESGKVIEVRVETAATFPQVGSGEITLSHRGRVLARAEAGTAAAGATSVVPLTFAPSADEPGWLRYDVAFSALDSIPADDARSIYIYVSPRPAGVVLLSLRPDWEPRFLLPVLEQALGVPARGYMRAGDRFLRIGTGAAAGRAADIAEVTATARAADLLVLHGLPAEPPRWLAEEIERAPRLLLLASDVAPPGASAWPAPSVGEWYVAPDPPPSPVAGYLAGLPVDSLAPLGALRPLSPASGVWAPLLAARGRQGTPAPVLIAGEAAGRRWAAATADGFWQWAIRPGTGRTAYRRFWGAIAGWLLREDDVAARAALRPAARSLPQGVAPRWVGTGIPADSVILTVSDADNMILTDTVLPWHAADTVATAVLPPGHYVYAARVLAGGTELARADGPLTVDAWSPEWHRSGTRLTGQGAAPGAARASAWPRSPLHTSPIPYLLIVALVCTEWVLRRRAGLR